MLETSDSGLFLIFWSFLSLCLTGVSILFYTKMHRQLFQLFQAFLLLPLTILLAQFSLTIFCINEVVRSCVSLLLQIRYRGKITLVKNGADAVWNYRSKGNTRMILIPAILSQKAVLFEHSVAIELEKRLFGNGNSVYRKLKSVIFTFCGYVALREVNDFNVRNHVRTLRRKEIYTEQDVAEVLSACAKDMDYSKPQWEILIIRRFIDETDGQEKSLLIFRFHHSYMDGMSMLMMLNNLSDDYKYLLNPLTTGLPKWKMVLYYANALIFGSTYLVQCLTNLFRRHWITNAQIPFGQKHFAWLRNQLKLESFQQIRSESKASISNIFALAFIEACRRVLPEDRLVKNVSVGEVIAFLPYPNTKPQNRFATFSYTADISPECVNTLTLNERLKVLKVKAQESVIGPQAVVVYCLFELIGRLPSFVVPQFLTATQDSLFLSNVPCAKETFTLFQGQCEAVGAFAPCFCDAGIMLAVVSYNEFLNVCAAADSSWLSQVEMKSILDEIPKVVLELEEGKTFSENQVRKVIYKGTTFPGVGQTMKASKNHYEPIKLVTSDGSDVNAQSQENFSYSQYKNDEDKNGGKIKKIRSRNKGKESKVL